MTPASEAHAPRIRVRLTALFATTLLVILLAASFVLRLAMRDALDREFDASVRASAALVGQFFRVEIAEYQTIEATVAHIAGELIFEDRVIHVRRPDGSEFSLLGAPVPHQHRPLQPPVRQLSWPLDPGLAPGWTILIEASGASVATVKARIDRWLAFGIPALVVLAGALGWWLTGRTLRPVAKMADAAARIVPGAGGRLPIADPDDELGRLGRRFNALLDRLDGALDQQRRFLADAAHELRTPLARLRSRVDLALLPPTGDNRALTGEVLPAIHDELVRMSRLVEELLQLARADAAGDGASTAMQPLYLDDLVTDELRMWQAEAMRASITIECSVLQEAPVTGDPVLLARLMGILVDNALRYNAPGGRVDVRVHVDDTQVMLDVEDDGIGLTADERPQIFERFYRGARARALRSDGSGLGLAIARWITETHHGTITLRSRPDTKGTLAQVVLAKRRTAQEIGKPEFTVMGAGSAA